MVERTSESVYETTMLDALAEGEQAAAVPVRHPDGQTGVWVASGYLGMDPEPNLMDVFAHAYVAIKRARLAAEYEGLHGVDS